MCLQKTVIYSPRWNWHGARIVAETIAPSGRSVVPEVTIPANLKNRRCFRFRGPLPHHNEIAVDEFPKKKSKSDYKIQKLHAPPLTPGNSRIGTTSPETTS
jgi:hypothetical protein